MKSLLYLLALLYILYKAYKIQKLYILLYIPLLLLSYFASTGIYSSLAFPFQFSILLAFIITVIFLMYFYRKDYKRVKLDILQEKRHRKKEAQKIQEANPSRKKRIVIEDLRTKEKKVYWTSPSIKERYGKDNTSE